MSYNVSLNFTDTHNMRELLQELLNSDPFKSMQPILDVVAQNTESFVAVVGLLIALWALRLQRREIVKNGKINALIHASKMLQEKIDYHNKILIDLEGDFEKSATWRGHANRINSELRPLKNQIDLEFLNIAAKYEGILHENKIRQALEPKRKETLESG